jgi:hypothetical protein
MVEGRSIKMNMNKAYRRRGWGLMLLGLLLAPFVVGNSAAAAAPARWAMVVGVDRYDSPDIRGLQCAGADANALAATLSQYAGIDRDHIILLSSDQKGRYKPTSTNVLGWFEALKARVRPGDDFIFYFSGHGIDENGVGYLLTADTDLTSPILLRKSALAVSEVKEALEALRVGHEMVILDACRSNPGKKSDSLVSRGLTRDLVLSARNNPVASPGEPPHELEVAATMFACKEGEFSLEGKQGHGYFTYYLCEGFKGAAADPQGRITLNSLDEYVRQRVHESVASEQKKDQNPWVEYAGGGTWVLAHASKVATRPSPEASPNVGTGREAGYARQLYFQQVMQPLDSLTGMNIADFETPNDGVIHVYLPDDAAKGDTISAMIFATPYAPSSDKEEQKKQFTRLAAYSVEMAGQRFKVSDGMAVWKIPANYSGRVDLVLRDPSGESTGGVGSIVGRLALNMQAAPEQPAEVKFPPVVLLHRKPLSGFQITGPFSGDARSTKVTSNGQDISGQILAESPRKLIIYPNALTMDMKVSQGSLAASGTVHVIDAKPLGGDTSHLQFSFSGLKDVSSLLPLSVSISLDSESETIFDKPKTPRVFPVTLDAGKVQPDGSVLFNLPLRNAKPDDAITLDCYWTGR